MNTEKRVGDKEAELAYQLADCIEGAERGDADDQVVLGECYELGCGVPQSYDLALKWFHAAADQGHIEAMNNLFRCYSEGHGVKRSLSEAIYWGEKLALASDGPEVAILVAYLHAGRERCLDWIAFIANNEMQPPSADDDIFGYRIGYAFGEITSDLGHLFETAGLPNSHNGRSCKAIVMLSALFTPIASLLPNAKDPVQLLIEDYAERISHYVTSAGTDNYEDPLEAARNVCKWSSIAKSKGNSDLHDLISTFAFADPSEASGEIASTSARPLEADCSVNEPWWNIDASSSWVTPVGLRDSVYRTVFRRLGDDAKNGSSAAKRVLTANHFFSELRRTEIAPIDRELHASLFPDSNSELDALYELFEFLLEQPVIGRQKIIERSDVFVALASVDEPRLRSRVLPQLRALMNERNQRGFDALLKRIDTTMTAEFESNRDFLNGWLFSLAVECLESSLAIDLILNDCDIRHQLSDAVRAYIASSARTTVGPHRLVTHELVCEELERIEETPEQPSAVVIKGMRYSPPVSRLASLLLVSGESDREKRISKLTIGHQCNDITSTYLLSTDAHLSLDERERLLICTINALSTLNANTRHTNCNVEESDNLFVLPRYILDLYVEVERQANFDFRLLKQEQLLNNEREKREAEENMMAMFAHKFRGPVDSILFNTAHQRDQRVYVDAARTMNGLLDIFSLVSTAPEKLLHSLTDDVGGDGSPAGVLLHALKLALLQLLSPRNRLRMSPHYLAWAKRQGVAPNELRQSEWMRGKTWVAKEIEIQLQWETEIGDMLITADMPTMAEWMSTHLLPLHVQGFTESTAQFAEYGPKASLLTVVFTEVLVNAIKHATSPTTTPLGLSWEHLSDEVVFICTNPSTRDSRDREKSKGSGRGHKFLKPIVEHAGGSFSADVLSDASWVRIALTGKLMTGDLS